MSTQKSGLLAVHTAVLIFGVTALFSKVIALSAVEITFLRSFIAALFIAGVLLWSKQALRLNDKKDYVISLFLGILLAVHWVTYFHSMQVSSIAVGVIALFTFPIITVFLEPLFHGKRARPSDIVSAIIVFLGVCLMIPEFSFENKVTQGVLWGIFSAFCFALRNVVQGRYFSHCSARHSLLYQSMVVFLVLLPFSSANIPNVTMDQWTLVIILGVFFTALPHTLLAFSLIHLKAKTVGLIACIQVVYASVIAAIVLGERPELSVVLGGCIIVTVALYESYAVKNR